MRGMVVSKCLCGRATLRGGMQRQTHAAKLLCQNVATGLDLLSKTRWRRPSIHQATTFSRVQARRPLTDSSKNQTVGEIGRRTKTVPLLCRLVCSKSCWTKSTVLPSSLFVEVSLDNLQAETEGLSLRCVRGVLRTQLRDEQIEFGQTQHHVLGRLIQDHLQLLVLGGRQERYHEPTLVLPFLIEALLDDCTDVL